MRIRKFRYIAFFSLVMLAMISFVGCRSQKSLVSPGTSVGPKEISSENMVLSPESCFRAVEESYGTWEDITASLRFTLTQPTDFGVSARATMRRGEWIALSVRMLGFEVASAWIDADSVIAVTKHPKRYVAESLSAVFGSTGLSVADLQDILLGRVFYAGKVDISPSQDVEYPDLWYLTPQLPNDSPMQYGYVFQNTTLLNMGIMAGARTASVAYAEPITIAGRGTFYEALQLQTILRDKPLEASVSWNLQGAKWDTSPAPKKPRPSKGYTRIPAASLLRILSM